MSAVKGLFNLEGRKAVVTGGAGGIGSAISSGFADLGVDIALFDTDVDAMDAVKEELSRGFAVRILAIPTDVCKRSQVEDAVERTVEEFGRIDILVNCHGVGQWSAAEEMSEEDWERMIDVNLKGVFFMCQAVGRRMIERRYGKIVNIASMSGSIVNKPQAQSHYNASKAGVIMLTKSLAAEWAEYNVNVNSVSPGYTLTSLVERLLKNEPEYAELWKPLIPLGRFAQPADIVGSVIFLSCEASSYITGHNLAVDGGYTVW